MVTLVLIRVDVILRDSYIIQDSTYAAQNDFILHARKA